LEPSDTTWRDFFVSEVEERLGADMEALGSPDSGIEACNFDMEQALLWDRDPVMRQDEFEDEVDFMFNKPAYTSFNGELDLDFAMPELAEVISFNQPCDDVEIPKSDVIIEDKELEEKSVSSDLNLEDDVITDTEESAISDSKSISPAAQIHTYSAAPKVKRLQSVTKKFDLKSSRGRRTINKKKKLYELQKPLANPQAERCRLNAINAKKNRDRKKRELEAAESEIARLRRENAELKAEAEAARDEREEAFAELEMMKVELKMLGAPVDEREE